MKKIFQYLFSLGLAGVLLWWVFKDIDLAPMLQKFKEAKYGWIVLSGLLTVVAHWSRAMRWRMLLASLGYYPSALHTTLAVFTGYFANYIVPRMGEVTRCGAIAQSDGVPIDKSLGTVVAERIFDVISLLFLIVLNFFLEFDRLQQFFLQDLFAKKPGQAGTSGLLLVAGAGLGLALLGALFLFFSPALRQRLWGIPLVQKVATFGQGLLAGILSIRKLKNPVLFLFYTVLIWTMYYFMAYVLFFAIPETENLSMLAALTILVVGSIGMTAPTQGGVGAYHLLVGKVAVLYGLSQDNGILLATFLHGSQMLCILLLGGLAFAWMLLLRRKQTATPNS
jgi:glycosyltransferase 2 family protein